MKKLLLIILIILLTNISCKKEEVANANILPINTAPKANAGEDIKILLPMDSCMLNGSAADPENNISSYLWSKISGPASYNLENPKVPVTKVQALEMGTYEFELMVTDKGGLTNKDTVTVFVSMLPSTINTAPQVFAGNDIQVLLPVDFCLLSGSAIDAENNIVSFVWTKISGPSSYNLENAKAPVTKVQALEKGIYEFELMVTDKGNLSNKDTVTVSVIDSSSIRSKEKIFKDLQWDCFWGCYINIPNFYSFIPYGPSLKVYIKRQDSNVWVEVLHESKWTAAIKYVYGIDNNNFWVYADNEDHTSKWEVNIIY